MKLKYLVSGIDQIEIRGSKEVEIVGLCDHSQAAAPGFLFFAKKGYTQDGSQFCHEAALAGVSAIVTDLFDPFLSKVVQIICPDVTKLQSVIAQRFYANPSEKLLTVGITGTNGKTTCSYLIKYGLDVLGFHAGLIGTIEYVVKDLVLPSSHTTPSLLTNQRLLHEMVLQGCKSVVMEVSSHSIHQKRIEGIDFDVGVFTNLTQDHLDYHKDMEQYAAVKASFFAKLQQSEKKYPKSVIINIDCPWAEIMKQGANVAILTYGFSSQADVQAQDLHLSLEGSRCNIVYKGEKKLFQTSLIGKFNVYNCLAAISCLVSLGWDFSVVIDILSSFRSVPGRMERVGKNIFVDYAHTDDALKNVLQTLREVTEGRVICVFGCGGDRDPYKRPKMGRVAEQFADFVFVTSDNPRTEVPEKIIADILSGMQKKTAVRVEIDRQEAIKAAIACLGPQDVLLIAGKGHEKMQIFAHHTIHFDDRIVAKEYAH